MIVPSRWLFIDKLFDKFHWLHFSNTGTANQSDSIEFAVLIVAFGQAKGSFPLNWPSSATDLDAKFIDRSRRIKYLADTQNGQMKIIYYALSERHSHFGLSSGR